MHSGDSLNAHLTRHQLFTHVLAKIGSPHGACIVLSRACAVAVYRALRAPLLRCDRPSKSETHYTDWRGYDARW